MPRSCSKSHRWWMLESKTRVWRRKVDTVLVMMSVRRWHVQEAVIGTATVHHVLVLVRCVLLLIGTIAELRRGLRARAIEACGRRVLRLHSMRWHAGQQALGRTLLCHHRRYDWWRGRRPTWRRSTLKPKLQTEFSKIEKRRALAYKCACDMSP